MLHRIANFTTILTFGIAVFAVLLAPAQAAPGVDCEAKPNHPQCQPGNESQPVTPATITYASGNDIVGDGVYTGLNSPDGLEVFIGSQAATGNIFLQQHDPSIDGRTLGITIPANECGLTTGLGFFPLRFANAKPDTVIQNGVFGMAEGESNGSVPMKIMFEDGANEYFLNFNPSQNGPCKDQSSTVQVTRLLDVGGKGRWSVSDNGTACIEKRTSKGKNQFCAGLVPLTFSFTLDEL